MSKRFCAFLDLLEYTLNIKRIKKIVDKGYIKAHNNRVVKIWNGEISNSMQSKAIEWED